jgi:hypothetical protein
MAKAKTTKKAAAAAAEKAAAGLPPVPAGAVRVSLPGQPKADVEKAGDGTYRVSYPTPQPFWTDDGAPPPVEVEAAGPGDAYDAAGGVNERPLHTIEKPAAE